MIEEQKFSGRNERLLFAVNEAAQSVRNGWIFFVGMMAFFFIAVAGVTHQDLLLNSPVQLPLIKIDIELTRFFQFAPLAVVLFHFGVLLQYTLLSGKTLALHDVLTKEEKKNSDPSLTHPLRMELSSYFFVQAMAGPARSPILSVFLKALTVLTLGLFPLVLLLYFQTTYLAFHDSFVTWAHRFYIVADLLVLVIIGIFTQFPTQAFKDAFRSHMKDHSIGIYVTIGLGVIALFYSFCVATLPDSALDKAMTSIGNAVYLSRPVPYGTNSQNNRTAFLPTAWMFEGKVIESSGRASSWFSRNLIVTDVDLVPYVNADREKANEVSLHLRGRDLRYANFALSDMHRADFKEADLTQVKFSESNLSFARFRGAQMSKTDLRNAKMAHADLRWAKMQNADLKNAILNGANLSSANLRSAQMKETQLQDANLQWANLFLADLSQANLRKAILSRANLRGAILNGAELQEADLFKVMLSGGALRNAQLQKAILLWANLKAADFRGAQLQGSDLRSTNMAMTDLRGATLQGADLFNTDLTFADLKGVSIWQTMLLKQNKDSRINARGIILKQPKVDNKQNSYDYLLKKTPQQLRKEANEKRLLTLGKSKTMKQWKKTKGYKLWQGLKAEQPKKGEEDAYKGKLSDALADLACADRSSKGWLIHSIVRRAIAVFDVSRHKDNRSSFPPFNGDVKRLYERLQDKSCLARQVITAPLMKRLKQAATQ